MLKKIVMSILFSTLITGCMAGPQFINGHYYMTGDSDCLYWRTRTDTSIDCYSSKSDTEPNFYRNAMTDQQMQMHLHQKREFNESMRSLNESNKTTTCYNYGTVITCN
jgi:hypothetical protein